MSKLDEAEILLENREEDHPANLERARDLFIEGKDEDEPASWTGLAETYFWLGEYASSNDVKETNHSKGVEAGKKAVTLASSWVDAHLWYAANMGSHGVVRGIMSSLFYLKDLERHGKLAMEIDEAYFYGAPLRLMGRFYHQCPGWPIGAGDIKKSITLLEKAVETGPDFILNHVYLAEAYMAKKRKSDAQKVLEKTKEVQAPEGLEVYHKMIQKQVQELSAKV